MRCSKVRDSAGFASSNPLAWILGGPYTQPQRQTEC